MFVDMYKRAPTRTRSSTNGPVGPKGYSMEDEHNNPPATCMVSLSTESGLSQYEELEAQR